MLALVDADVVTYRVGFTTENDDEAIACWRANDCIEKILADTNADQYKLFLTADSDPQAFRKLVYPEYKANRTKPRPKYYQSIRDFLTVDWGAEVVQAIEADDALAITALANEESIICSIDKDLLQVPGNHYNFVKETFTHVLPTDGLRSFYNQLLVGDSVDNIRGVTGVGAVKSRKILEGKESERELFDAVREAYGNDEEMLMNGRVLWIWRHIKDDWKHHFERLSGLPSQD